MPNYLLITHLCFLQSIILPYLQDDFSDWAFHWKNIFNPDATKQAQEVIFSQKFLKKKLILL